ncbi:hypothetical protein [Maribacter luteus]|uniref:hypothetical protein n=1 Tax=Maribacter luteus TaxID=2594478 RepID=UPI002490AE52|nr:hypothetical protein [Maribacter luteus]
MNYIKQLNTAFQLIMMDSRLNPTHVSLYMALFQLWNITRFAEVFYVNRQEVMQLSKIGSKSTYHRCLKDLDNWNYIEYLPSHNIFKGSEVRMPIFGTTSEQQRANNETTTEHVLVSNTNSIKQKENSNKPKLPKNEIEVIDFFKTKKWPALEAMKFFNHYQAIGWKHGGKIKIVDWMASASNWMLKAKEIETLKEQSHFKDNLRTTKTKDYDEPL